MADDAGELLRFDFEDADIQVRDAAKRELDVRLLPWGTTIETANGPEEFRAGADLGVADDGLLLMEMEHEARLAMGSNGQTKLARRPAGRSTKIWADEIGPRATFKVAKTQAGDEMLELAAAGVVRGISPEFFEVNGGTTIERRGNRRVRVHNRVRMTGASMTYRPAYGDQAAVLAVRSQEEASPMGDTDGAQAGAVDATPDKIIQAIASMEERFRSYEEKAAANERASATLFEKFEQRDEQFRSQFELPAKKTEENQKLSIGHWAKLALTLAVGDRLSDAQMRTLDDVITTDNPGVVPPAYLTDLRGVIDTRRPFLGSTRRLDTPDSGTKLNVPVITQRPTTAIQSAEKTEVDSTKTIIGVEDFDMITIAGAGDLSIQLIRRSSPSFLSLWIELLSEAYAEDAETEAIKALALAMGGFGGASALDPADLELGSAFVTSFDAVRRPPDTLWLSTEAVGEFIDAKATGTNSPLYPGLVASATAAGGIEGTISGLRAVHVPALDAHGAYAIVGPSSGFAWAEDGTFTLQADVPSKLGRDVALAGLMWMVPWYPAAFTAYNVAS
jgi:hypothetical protein